MITFKEIAKRLDKSKENEARIEIDELIYDLGIDGICMEFDHETFIDKNKGRLSCYYIKRGWWEEERYSTYKMYFFKGEPIGISTHNPDITYYWCGLEEAEELKEYLIGLFKRDDRHYLELIDFEHDTLDEFYKLNDIHEAEMNKERAYCNGEKIEGLYRSNKNDNLFVNLILESGEILNNITFSDLDFKLHLLDEK